MQLENFQKRCNENCWLLLGIPVIVIMGILLHYAYKWSNYMPLIGIIAPINESVWEHLKLSFFPTLFWWLLGYFIYKKESDLTNWFNSLAISLVTAPIIIVVLHYLSIILLGSHNVILDILIYIFAIIISQLIGLILYNCMVYNSKLIPLIIILVLFIMFVYFTYYPPDLNYKT